jgi:hypothetical protein
MTKLLDEALERVRQLPADSQDEIARTMLHLAEQERAPEVVEPAHLRAVLEGLAQAARREYASEHEVEAAFRAFDVTHPPTIDLGPWSADIGLRREEIYGDDGC